MSEIDDGFCSNFSMTEIEIYAKTEFSWQQMSWIKYGIHNGLEVLIYAKKEYSSSLMSKIFWILKEQPEEEHLNLINIAILEN